MIGALLGEGVRQWLAAHMGWALLGTAVVWGLALRAIRRDGHRR